MEINKIYYPITRNTPKIDYTNFQGNKDNNVKLSSEIEEAFLSKDYDAKRNYFKDLVDNTGLVLRSCDDDEYVKSTQVLLDNIKYDKYGNNDLFENQIELLRAFVKPNSRLKEQINPDKFCTNFKDFMHDDDYIVDRINQIYKAIGRDEKRLTLDISSHSEYPVNILSNFSDTNFKIDGVTIKSMEGFLQSLKTPNKKEQEYICSLDGLSAKGIGKKLNKKRNYDFKNLYWNGQRINRNSEEYQKLIKRAYEERFIQDEDFRFALEYTKEYELKHSLGGKNPKNTLLTEQEFITILDILRQNFS